MKRNNVTVSITATADDLQASLATAAKETRALSTELTKLVREGGGVPIRGRADLDGVLLDRGDREALRAAAAMDDPDESLLDSMNDPNLTPEQQEELRERAVREYYGTGQVDPDMAEKLDELRKEGFVSIDQH